MDDQKEQLLLRIRELSWQSRDAAFDEYVAEQRNELNAATQQEETARRSKRDFSYGSGWWFGLIVSGPWALAWLSSLNMSYRESSQVLMMLAAAFAPLALVILAWLRMRGEVTRRRAALRTATDRRTRAQTQLTERERSWQGFQEDARRTVSSNLVSLRATIDELNTWIAGADAFVPASDADWPDVPAQIWSTFGRFTTPVGGQSVTIPCPVVDWTNFDGAAVWCLDANEVDALQKRIVLDLLRQVPPSSLHFHIFDPRTLGSGVAPFARLTSSLQRLFGNGIWTDPRTMPELIGQLSTEIGRRQRTLGESSEANGWDLNRRLGRMEMSLEVLLITSLDQVSRDTLQLLRPVLEMGPNVLIVPIVFLGSPADVDYFSSHNDAAQNFVRNALPNLWLNGPMDRALNDVSPTFPDTYLASGVEPNGFGGGLINPHLGHDSNNWSLGAGPWTPRGPTLTELEGQLDQLTAAVADHRVKAKDRTAVRMREVIAGGHQESSKDGLSIPVGKSGDAPLDVLLGDDPVHGLVIGQTGSGKSNFLHAFIHSAIARYGPEELELVLVDMKEGVEFIDVYAVDDNHAAFPNIAIVAADADPEFGAGVLADTVSEIARRGELFRQYGVRSFAALRDAGCQLPRRIVIIDEFQRVFRDERLQETAWKALAAVATEGRAFGVHLVLATQTLVGVPGGGLPLARGALDQFGLRIALACSEEDSVFLLDDKSASTLGGPGEGFVSTRRGTDDNRRVRIARFDDQEFAGLTSPSPAVVFHGRPREFADLPEDLRGSAQLARLPLGVASDLGAPPTLDLWSEPFRHLGIMVGGAANAGELIRILEAAGGAAADRGWEVLIWDMLSPANPMRPQLDALWASL
ncbi:MAG: FtsK/SpoIIIE domain-containing protein, partial [Microthrixaceae bacterium]